MKAYALYLHIPFCAIKCSYCAFNTYANQESLIPAFVAALCNEIRFVGAGQAIRTVYFGGGTPSVLSPEQFRQIMTACRQAFAIDPAAEITAEVNPNDATPAYLAALRALGVNRLSLGMQSAHEPELRLMARDHGLGGVQRAVEAARAAGFTNLSLDLIFGWPGQTLRAWQESVSAALALHPDHLSMYALELEPGTAITRQVERGRLILPDDDLTAEMYDWADQAVTAAGLPQYEISNWARPGTECAHNLIYWDHGEYIGVGAGAHGYAAGLRYETVKPIQRYIALAAGQTERRPFPLTAAVETWEAIDPPTQMMENLFTGLRRVKTGVNDAEFTARFGQSLDSVYGQQIERLIRRGLLVRVDGWLRLTPAARLISNAVFRELMP